MTRDELINRMVMILRMSNKAEHINYINANQEKDGYPWNKTEEYLHAILDPPKPSLVKPQTVASRYSPGAVPGTFGEYMKPVYDSGCTFEGMENPEDMVKFFSWQDGHWLQREWRSDKQENKFQVGLRYYQEIWLVGIPYDGRFNRGASY